VANLEVMATRARYEVLWISDSNTTVHPDALAAMVDEVEAPGVGVVVSPVIGVGEQTAGAALENLQLSAYAAAGGFVVWALLGRVTAPGKSMLLHRRTLDSIGGFAWLGRHLAEDHVLVERLRALGLRNVLGRYAVANVNRTGSVQRFLDRHQRWTQLRWLVTAPSTLLEPLLSPMTATALLLLCAPSATTLALFLAAAALHLVLDLCAMRALRGSVPALRYWPLVCARPLCSVWLWARAAFNRRVVWRGNVRWLGANSAILAEPAMRTRLRAIRNAVVR
jgi:ceramide glucosyltransferase